MEELITKIVAETGVTNEQAKKSIEVIKNYVIEKFPMLENAAESLFGNV